MRCRIKQIYLQRGIALRDLMAYSSIHRNNTMEVFNGFSEWLQGRIVEAPEWKSKHGTANVPSKSINLESDDPFSDDVSF